YFSGDAGCSQPCAGQNVRGLWHTVLLRRPSQKKEPLPTPPATGGGLVDAGARVLTFAARLVRRRLVVSIDRREMVDAGRAGEHSIDCAKSVFASVDRSPQWSRSTPERPVRSAPKLTVNERQ